MMEALAIVKERVKATHRLVLGLVDSLSDDQIARQPAPRAHSVAWTVWHIARCADKLAIELGADGSGDEIWIRDDLARRWKLPTEVLGSNGAGTGIDDVLVSRVRAPAKADLLDYTRRALAAEAASVGALDERSLARDYDSGLLERRATVGEALMVCVTHEARHLGELEYIRGLLGFRGTASR